MLATREPDAPSPDRGGRPDGEFPDHEWVARLSATGQVREQAVERLHALMLRATRHRVRRMPAADDLGAARREEIIHSAAADATLAVLSRLESFEGRSRFTTWAYKFGILQAGVEVRRHAWNGRTVELRDLDVRTSTQDSPERQAEARDLSNALRRAMADALTDHQRRVALALIVDGIPIDVLADRLGTNRNALYKTLHDARRRLRHQLQAEGLLDLTPEVIR